MFDKIANSFSSLFSQFTGNKRLDQKTIDATLDSVHDALLDADVAYEVAEAFLQDMKNHITEKEVHAALKPDEHIMKIVHDRLAVFLGGQEGGEAFSFQFPSVVMVMGLQGSGKTTTIAKLARYIKQQAARRTKERSILIGSIDYYRPAAIEQLRILSERVGCDFYQAETTDPIEAARELHERYQSGGYDMLLLDTAGRLHVDEAMIQELSDVASIVKPQYKILVLDAMTGQASLDVARTFDNQIGFSGAILTKMDSDTRGGAAFAFRYMLQKSILFVGSGEGVDQIELFRPKRMAQRMLGMGDLMTLVEQAEEKVKKSEREQLEKAVKNGKITLEDFRKQLEMVSRMGSFSHIMQYMPGASKMNVSDDTIEKGEQEMKQFSAIMNSMTKKERIEPKLLNSSRKQRIARGAGVTQKAIDHLLKRFRESQQMLKSLKKMGGLKNLFK